MSDKKDKAEGRLPDPEFWKNVEKIRLEASYTEGIDFQSIISAAHQAYWDERELQIAKEKKFVTETGNNGEPAYQQYVRLSLYSQWSKYVEPPSYVSRNFITTILPAICSASAVVLIYLASLSLLATVPKYLPVVLLVLFALSGGGFAIYLYKNRFDLANSRLRFSVNSLGSLASGCLIALVVTSSVVTSWEATRRSEQLVAQVRDLSTMSSAITELQKAGYKTLISDKTNDSQLSTTIENSLSSESNTVPSTGTVTVTWKMSGTKQDGLVFDRQSGASWNDINIEANFKPETIDISADGHVRYRMIAGTFNSKQEVKDFISGNLKNNLSRHLFGLKFPSGGTIEAVWTEEGKSEDQKIFKNSQALITYDVQTKGVVRMTLFNKTNDAGIPLYRFDLIASAAADVNRLR